MANALTALEKHQLCTYKDEYPNLSGVELTAYCTETFGKMPSKSQISRVLGDHKKGKRWNVTTDEGKTVKRIRGSKFPELEKALDLWIMQVKFACSEQER